MATMSQLNLRKRPRVCYYEPEEPPFDEYVFCTECSDYVYEYCSIHGPLLIIPDEKVPTKTGYPDFVPRAALTIPRVFLHLANSNIEGAGIGVFSTLTLPIGVRFGPYRGVRAPSAGDSSYAWQIYDKNHKPLHVIDARDDNASNWMRYVNCSRHVSEQNLVAYQYQGQLYYRTIKVIPRFDELLVFYGSEFAATLGVELRLYSVPCECYGCQELLPKKAQFKRNKRPAPIEDKPREEKILKENPVEEKQEPSTSIPKDLQTNNGTTVSASANATEEGKIVKPKKKKNDKKSSAKKSESHIKLTDATKKPAVKFQVPVIKSTNTLIASVADKKKNFTDVPLNDSKTITVVFKCDKCNETFDIKSDLEKHIDTHKYDDDSTTEKHEPITHNNIHNVYKSAFTSKSSLNYHKKTHTKEKSFKCNYCEFSCTQKESLTRHIRTHTGQKLYTCNVSSSSFSDKSNLADHEKTHTKERPHKCNLCNYACIQKHNLTRHIRMHTGEKPYNCNHCTYSTADKSHLTTHIRKHTGEKPYNCNHCTFSAASKSHLTLHIRKHTGEKPYNCNHCTFSTAQKCNLTTHIRKHTGEKPYNCNHCTFSTAHKSNLTTHIRKHTGEKPYNCNHCTYSTAKKSHLTRHSRKHTGEKPYNCNHCTYSTARKSDLTTHIRKHTGENRITVSLYFLN
ncbi:uncharacterized protein [Choristoneura fumiferana]|uniref:uncharacterized protein n=1 Tax=Choristoneura fumiferana TaxID=7141 RepID=UPI003D1567C2